MQRTGIRQAGSGVIEILFIAFVIIGLAATGWVLYQHHQSANKAAATTEQRKTTSTPHTQSTDPYTGWKTYTSTADHFSIKYPSTWILDATGAPYNQVGYDSATLTSPSKTVLNLYANIGGKGGWCTPAPQDVPFKKGNACATLEYLTSEGLAINNLYYKAEVPNTDPIKFEPKQASVYLVTTHYADQSGTPVYGISIAETTTSKETFQLNSPYMGAYVPYTWLTVYDASGQFLPYIYVYANSNSSSFLTSDDAATIKNIIRSFTLHL